MSYIPPNPNGQSTMASSSPVAIASDQSPISITDTILENLVDQLSHLINRLSFLASLQNPTDGRLRVNLADGLTFVGATLGAVATVTSVTNIANQTGQGGFGTQHVVMAQMNTNVATAIRNNIKVT